ncbi:MAG: hypothetical protein DVB22_001406 [Verrucomicrobia bacterium]|jgi:hypothetical protein|nr:MAG: hypothetical protein DVB22_001406 [Verrucomicrobiota bacterium]
MTARVAREKGRSFIGREWMAEGGVSGNAD